MEYKLQLENNFIKHYKKLTAVERSMVDFPHRPRRAISVFIQSNLTADLY